MINDYETIIEHILEAKDKGISLASLLEKHPEQKGEYFDAWKFVDGIGKHLNSDTHPDKKSFYMLIQSLPEQKPIVSKYMPYIAFATPVFIVLFVVLSYSSSKNSNITPVALVTENTPQTPELFDASTQTEITAPENSSFMAKSVSPIQSPLESSIASLENAYNEDFSSEQDSSIRFASTSDYSNLSSLYE